MVMSLLQLQILNNADATLIVADPADNTKGVLFGTTAYTSNDILEKGNFAPTPSHGHYATRIRNLS